MPTYRVELANTGRAGCQNKECKDAGVKIEKGEFRFGTLITIQDHTSWRYKHWGCVTPEQIANMIEISGGDTDMVDGYDEIPPELQKKVEFALENGHVPDEDWKGDVEVNRPGEKGFRVKPAKQPKKKGKKKGDDEEDEAPKKTKSKKRVAKDDDDEEAPAPKKARGRSKKAATKPKEEEESEDEAEAPPPKKARGKPKMAASKAKEEEDAESEAEEPPPKKGRGKPKKAAPKKEVDDDDDDAEEPEPPKAKRGRKKAPADDSAAKVPQKRGRPKKTST